MEKPHTQRDEKTEASRKDFVESLSKALTLSDARKPETLAGLKDCLDKAIGDASGAFADDRKAVLARLLKALSRSPDLSARQAASVWAKLNSLLDEFRAEKPGLLSEEKQEANQKGQETSQSKKSPKADSGWLTSLMEDPALIKEFLTEAEEHLDNADSHLINLEKDGNVESLNAVFRAFHTIKGNAAMLGFKTLERVAHAAETLMQQFREAEKALGPQALQAIFQTVDALRELCQSLNNRSAQESMPEYKELEELLENLAAGNQGQSEKTSELEENSDREKFQEAVQSKSTRSVERTTAKGRGSIRVDAQKFDSLLDSIGELVIAESMMSHSKEVQAIAATKGAGLISRMDKITRDLQEMATSLRVIPVKTIFQRMARLVRDQAKKSGKKVDFVVTGEDTEVDKSVVEVIGDPLVHLLRNAVDHGIENPLEREKAGKPVQAKLHLRAFHREGQIFIEVQDDGKGLDRKAIIEKAVQKNLISPEARLDEHELSELIMSPGFSTSQQVSEYSGRGVGLDVVRKNIEAVGGQVEVRSKKDQGTTFSLRLPLTLAIIDGMVVRQGSDQYIIPTTAVGRAIQPKAGQVSTVFGRGELINLEEELLPLFRLGSLFDAGGLARDPCDAIAIVLQSGERRACLLFDEMMGKQQVVIKPLGDFLRGVRGISGSAIMPDGGVGLILDVDGLIELAHTNVKTEMLFGQRDEDVKVSGKDALNQDENEIAQLQEVGR